MKKWLGILLACILIMNLIPAISEEAGNASTEAQEEQVVYDYDDLVIGNPTQMNGQFFTALVWTRLSAGVMCFQEMGP